MATDAPVTGSLKVADTVLLVGDTAGAGGRRRGRSRVGGVVSAAVVSKTTSTQ